MPRLSIRNWILARPLLAGPSLVGPVLAALLLSLVLMPASHSFAQPEDTAAYLDLLLPAMGAEKIEASEAAQRQWEQTCREICRPGREKDRVAASMLMAERLTSKTADGARIWLLRQLEYTGGEECVVAVARLLDDENPLVQRAARRTLTMIPGSAANTALLAKLAATDDETVKLGLLNGLAQRADEASARPVAKALRSENEAVVVAAARALGYIATPLSAEFLKSRRKQAAGDLRWQIGNASLRCANRLLAKGEIHKAAELFGDLTGEGEPEAVRMSAVHGQIAASGDWQTVVSIAQFLRGDDLAAARVAAGHVADLDSVRAKRLAGILGDLSPAHQILLVQALALRADKNVLPEVLKLAKSDDAGVRIAAIRALATLGDASVVELLLTGLAEGGRAASAARHALEAVYGEGVEAKIIASMQSATNLRALLIEVLHRRRAVAAVPALLEETGHADVEIRRRAMAALSELAEIDDVPAMVAGVLTAERGAERDSAEKAVMLLCNRVADRQQRADPVLAVYAKASETDQSALLPLLGRIGGAQAFEKVRAALASDDKDLYGVGVRSISNWPDGDVAPQLLEIFQTADDEGHKLRAMRAFIRVIALRNERPNEESLDLLKQAMDLCERDEERNLILSRTISAEIRSIEALRFVLPYVNNPATAQMACRAIVGLSHHRYLRRPNQEEFNKALSEVIRVSNDVALRDQARRYRSDL